MLHSARAYCHSPLSGHELELNGSQNPNKWKPHLRLLRHFRLRGTSWGDQLLQLGNDLVTMLDNQGNMSIFWYEVQLSCRDL